jgi:predicted alpha/beta-hydrolase family hydrolase
MEAGRKRPDHASKLTAAVRAAAAFTRETWPSLPLLAGGKSMGGRMTSMAQSEAKIDGVRGLVFFGFPLHPPKKADTKRAEHLKNIDCPSLFLQGTRDTLADLQLLAPIVQKLPGATLHVVDGADHGFHVLKRSGRNDEEVLDELADSCRDWALKSLDSDIDPDLLRATISDFYDRLFDDAMIGFLFAGKDKKRLIEREWEFTLRLLGNRSIPYRGRTMRAAHAKSPILGGHFERRLQLLKDTMEAHAIPKEQRDRWVEHTLSLRSQITADKGSECKDTKVEKSTSNRRVLLSEDPEIKKQ